MRIFFGLVVFCVSGVAHAVTVNRLNGGMTVRYLDFSISGPTAPLELFRSYYSITAMNESKGWLGAFGWGWTSEFETALVTTAERNVVLRDGATGNTLLFKPERENPKAVQAFLENAKRAYFQKTRGQPLGATRVKFSEKILSRLTADPDYRKEFAAEYNMTGKIPGGEIHISTEYGYQTLRLKNNQWVRERDGTVQTFSNDGKLASQVDRGGSGFEYRYSPNKQLREIVAIDRSSSLKFIWRNDRVAEIVDNRGNRARYQYDAGNHLIQIVDSDNQIYLYRYENKKFSHLLTRILYPKKQGDPAPLFRELRYDDSGLVVSYREKDGSETQYLYGKSPQDPENNFWTKTVRKEGGTAEEQVEEFFLKPREDGSKYLYKSETKAKGRTITTLYTACCGKPSQIVRDGQITTFKYFEENALLKEKVSPTESVEFEYHPVWKKPSKVKRNDVVYEYSYDKRGNLEKASRGKTEKVALRYNRLGQIFAMNDPKSRELTFRYELGRPSLISQKGLGSIRIEYDRNGTIVRAETQFEGKGRKLNEVKSQEIIAGIMKGFQNYLEILRPAGINLNQE